MPLNAAVRHGPALIAAPVVPFVAPWLGYLPFDPWWLVFVPLGFLLGVMARAGRLIGEHKSWCDIRRDLGISLLISGANMLLAALIIQQSNLGYLPGLAVSFGCAFSGVGSVIEATRLGFMWLFRHFVEDSGKEAEEVQRLLALASLEAERAEKHRLTRVELRKERGDEDQ